MLGQEILKRKLPPLLSMNDGRVCTKELWSERRIEILDILQKNIYGYTPKPPSYVLGEIVEESNETAFAGNIKYQKIDIIFDTPNGEFSFPMHLFLPRNVSCAPLFLNIAFRIHNPYIFCPVEEIVNNGFGLAIIHNKDISSDNLHGDFSSGLAKLYIDKKERRSDEWGRIGIWAYGASRALDYLITRDDIDQKHIAVVGHSRLGKAALWCAAQDERFFMAISNDSGILGAAIAKHSTGEKFSNFINYGSWDWLCENFKKYVDKEDDMPFDQHFLLAAIAPRFLCVGSAEFDEIADPKSEFLSCVIASEAYKLLGYRGLVTPDEYPAPGTSLHEGEIGYHIRQGYHSFNRYDWDQYMKFMSDKMKNKESSL